MPCCLSVRNYTLPPPPPPPVVPPPVVPPPVVPPTVSGESVHPREWGYPRSTAAEMRTQCPVSLNLDKAFLQIISRSFKRSRLSRRDLSYFLLVQIYFLDLLGFCLSHIKLKKWNWLFYQGPLDGIDIVYVLTALPLLCFQHLTPARITGAVTRQVRIIIR